MTMSKNLQIKILEYFFKSVTDKKSYGLINYLDTKPVMSSLLVFYRVYRLEIQSVMLLFSTGFLNYYSSSLLSG
jgi:hypothetical protein